MYICYLDESGVPQKNAGTTAYFVLLGLAIPAVSWRQKDAEIAEILNARNFYGEIHTAWMARMYPEQERIADFASLDPGARKRAVLNERKLDLAKAALHGSKAVKQLAKNYEKTSAYVHLTLEERLGILWAAADQIGSWTDAVIFADAQRKAANAGDEDRILEHAFEQVVTRFHHHLERHSTEVGLIVQDQNETAARRLTQLARKYHTRGTTYSQVSRLVETPLFVDSRLTSMVQLADLCAYAVRRNFENGETDLLERFYHRFDRSAGKLVGIRHYTGKQACTCRICIDHGRPAPRARKS
jgi:Protein of unknown function (DUF3800)